MTDFEHIDCLNAHWPDDFTFSISLVWHAGTGQIFVEVDRGGDAVYVPTALDPAEVASWDGAWDVFTARAGVSR
ncbi:hypothetical protein AB0M95_01935 [Sphaerisporangium sp. NPDC051017]|uniref:hypothetical protein n=1 Tax=Sphaerisporangium sp. NPDC051017 TaxID=3154636 RepID=UPI00344A0FF0